MITTQATADLVTVTASWLRDCVAAVFTTAGLSPTAASTVAEALVDADLRGVPSHGTMLVPMYVDRILAGSVSRHEQGVVVHDAGAVAVLDGRHALGQLIGDEAIGIAVSKAKRSGVGICVVRHAFHFGAASRYVLQAAADGCIGVAAANTRPLMPAPGGAKPVVGNNPLAIAVPDGTDHPIVLDMALSEAALGKIRLAAAQQQPIPETWATDTDGRPTTDPQQAIAGMLQPAAGHKGFGLAFMIDVLSGVLAGGGFGGGGRGLRAAPATPNDCAHFFLAVDVASFGDPHGFAARLDELTDSVRTSPRAPGTERLFTPGEIEAERYVAAVAIDSVEVDQAVLTGLEKSSRLVGAELPQRVAKKWNDRPQRPSPHHAGRTRTARTGTDIPDVEDSELSKSKRGGGVR